MLEKLKQAQAEEAYAEGFHMVPQSCCRFAPRLWIVDSAPGWLVTSDRAAYHPRTRTILICKYIDGVKRPKSALVVSFIHEFIHHCINAVGGSYETQLSFDSLWVKASKLLHTKL